MNASRRTFRTMSEMFKERFVSEGRLNACSPSFRLFVERSFHDGVQPFLRYHRRLLQFISPYLSKRPEITEPGALCDDALCELKRLREAAERVVGRAALIPHLCASRLRQRTGERVQIVAEQEL